MALWTQAVYGTLGIGMIVFLVWLAYYTRLKPVLAYAVWLIVSQAVSRGLMWEMGRFPARFATFPVTITVWSIVSSILSYGLFVGMLLSLVRRGQPGAPLSWRRSAQEG